ncbi:YcaO-like family protein [Agromyces atrinae]|uniref:YcaO-like family protein n=1 Tax=Agromyces atrinae TaxID=592376 RepID=UPI001F56921C|nr:YcaO-like family protein [Agromyces atrinae]MCI2957682.1 YcaO-like family protein [Agromyces atrinae]
MIDVAATLDPANGLVRRVMVRAPRGGIDPLWTIGADIGNNDAVAMPAGFDMTWVGAAGFRRGRTLARAAGEAVERFALSPRQHPERPRADRQHPDRHEPYPPLIAHSLADGSRTEVDAALVNYPPRDAVAHPDAGPSGAAAGATLASAIDSACRELIERDVAQRAWWGRASVERIAEGEVRAASRDVARLLDATPTPTTSTTPTTRASTRIEHLELRRAGLPPVILCALVDDRAGVACAGLALEVDPALAIEKATQEALQVRSLLADLRRLELQASAPVPLPVVGELHRARYWASDAGVDALHSWLDKLPASRAVPARPPATPFSAAVPDAVVVDLTPRLPPAIRDMGWHAVRAFSASLQPLRMTDAPSSNLAPDLRGDRAVLDHARRHPHPFV